MTSTLNPSELHDPSRFGYSHTVSVPANSELVFVSGQYASDAQGGVASADFGEQVTKAFSNLAAALAIHGMDLSDVVQLRTYVVDHNYDKLGAIVGVVNGLWPNDKPAQTILGAASLAMPDILFEVEAVAARS